MLDPVTNETYVQAAAGEQADVDRAVAAARRAFDEGRGRGCCPARAPGS